MVLIEGFQAQSACAGPFHHKHHIIHFLQFLQDDEALLIQIFDIVPVFSGKVCQKNDKEKQKNKAGGRGQDRTAVNHPYHSTNNTDVSLFPSPHQTNW